MKILISAMLSLSFVSIAIPAAAERAVQNAEVVTFEGESRGGAWLKRSRNRIDGRVMANVEDVGVPYTIWWIIFHRPEKCTGGVCDGDDVGPVRNEAADIAVLYGSGAISASNGWGEGVVNIDLHLRAGEPRNGPHLRYGKGKKVETHAALSRHPGPDDWDPDNPNDNWLYHLTNAAAIESFAIFPPAD